MQVELAQYEAVEDAMNRGDWQAFDEHTLNARYAGAVKNIGITTAVAGPVGWLAGAGLTGLGAGAAYFGTGGTALYYSGLTIGGAALALNHGYYVYDAVRSGDGPRTLEAVGTTAVGFGLGVPYARAGSGFVQSRIASATTSTISASAYNAKNFGAVLGAWSRARGFVPNTSAYNARNFGSVLGAWARQNGAAGRNPAAKLSNKQLSLLRETRVQGKLEGRFGNGNVLRERTLLDASGNKVIDPLTGTGRRIDFVVLDNAAKARFSIEVTSRNQVRIGGKISQLQHEGRIRSSGGVFVRDPSTGRLIDVSGANTRVIGVEPR